MQDDFERKQAARRDFRWLSIALILQEVLLIATAYGMQDVMEAYYRRRNPAISDEAVYELLWNTGVPMIAASLVGLVVVMIFLGRSMRRETPGERMGVRQFLIALVGIEGIQLLSMLVSTPLESFVESLGYSLEQAAEASTSASVTLSMLLYSVVIAPMVEELVFRGAVLRTLERWGRGFALVTSAVLFGLMHGNLTQLPVAIACGLLFGYIAQRFSLRASILTHAANNAFVEALGLMPEEWDAVWMAYSLLLILSAAYVLYWCLTRRKALLDWCRGGEEPVVKWFLSSVPVLLLLVLYTVRTLQSALPV